MDDIGPLIQYIISFIIAFIGGAGLTGIVVAIYEARVRRMEKAVDRFSELVLTPVLFRFLSVSGTSSSSSKPMIGSERGKA